MIVSTKGRYALRVMIDLAEHPSKSYIPLREIAKRQEISEKYLEIILKNLVRKKLLIGLRGKGGGYCLSRTPEQYTVGSILRAAEDTLAPVACLATPDTPCQRASYCRTLPIWQKLNELITDYLDSITLAALIEPNAADQANDRETAVSEAPK